MHLAIICFALSSNISFFSFFPNLASATAFKDRSLEKMGQSVPNTIFLALNMATASSIALGPSEEQSTWNRLVRELGNTLSGVRVKVTLSKIQILHGLSEKILKKM